jgi:hypothetical protein
LTGDGSQWQASCLRILPLCQELYQKLGKLGKRKKKKVLEYPGGPAGRQTYALLCLLVCGGCHSELSDRLQSGQTLSWYGLQGRWVGSVTPVGALCGPATKGLMTIGERGFAFDPFQSTQVVHGDIDENNQLVGKLVRAGPERQDLSLAFAGTAATADVIEGSLQSGRCRWTVRLHRG